MDDVAKIERRCQCDFSIEQEELRYHCAHSIDSFMEEKFVYDHKPRR